MNVKGQSIRLKTFRRLFYLLFDKECCCRVKISSK